MPLSIEATLDLKSVETGLERMERAGKNLGPVFRTLKPVMKADQQDHARNRESPEGAWAPRAKSTMEHYGRSKSGRRRSPRPLGKLLTAVQYAAGRNSVSATSRVAWSGVHQEGGRVGRGAVIPARPFLWISNSFLTTAELVASGAITAAFGGA